MGATTCGQCLLLQAVVSCTSSGKQDADKGTPTPEDSFRRQQLQSHKLYTAATTHVAFHKQIQDGSVLAVTCCLYRAEEAGVFQSQPQPLSHSMGCGEGTKDGH